MENLSLQDPAPSGSSGSLGPSAVPPPPPAGGAPQLPPQMFTTAAQLLDLTDSENLPFWNPVPLGYESKMRG